jgi:hypothetical protein
MTSSSCLSTRLPKASEIVAEFHTGMLARYANQLEAAEKTLHLAASAGHTVAFIKVSRVAVYEGEEDDSNTFLPDAHGEWWCDQFNRLGFTAKVAIGLGEDTTAICVRWSAFSSHPANMKECIGWRPCDESDDDDDDDDVREVEPADDNDDEDEVVADADEKKKKKTTDEASSSSNDKKRKAE